MMIRWCAGSCIALVLEDLIEWLNLGDSGEVMPVFDVQLFRIGIIFRRN